MVKMSVTEESDLSKEQARELSEHIWNDEDKRDFVLAVSGTISGRKAGLNNDREQFPQIGDLGLGTIRVPVLLVHGTADTDVRPDQTDNAAEHRGSGHRARSATACRNLPALCKQGPGIQVPLSRCCVACHVLDRMPFPRVHRVRIFLGGLALHRSRVPRAVRLGAGCWRGG